jgi:hypothetical protein
MLVENAVKAGDVPRDSGFLLLRFLSAGLNSFCLFRRSPGCRLEAVLSTRRRYMPCPYLKCLNPFLCYAGPIYFYCRANVLEQLYFVLLYISMYVAGSRIKGLESTV